MAKPYFSNAPVSWDILFVFCDMEKLKPYYNSGPVYAAWQEHPTRNFACLLSLTKLVGISKIANWQCNPEGVYALFGGK